MHDYAEDLSREFLEQLDSIRDSMGQGDLARFLAFQKDTSHFADTQGPFSFMGRSPKQRLQASRRCVARRTTEHHDPPRMPA